MRLASVEQQDALVGVEQLEQLERRYEPAIPAPITTTSTLSVPDMVVHATACARRGWRPPGLQIRRRAHRELPDAFVDSFDSVGVLDARQP